MTKEDKLAEEIRQLANRMAQMEKLFELQGEINGKLLENMNRVLLELAERDTQPKSSIIMPDRLNS